jgi:hypothetical protein
MAKAKQKPGKRLIFILVIIVVVVGLATSLFIIRHNHRDCYMDSSGYDTVYCLPKGECIAPNDGIVNCDQLNSDGSYKPEWAR